MPAGYPWPQVTMIGTAGTPYTVQNGDTLQLVASRFYGPNGSANGIAMANQNIDLTQGYLPVGAVLMIPPAPGSASVPGGASGNGIGPGSAQYGPVICTRAKDINQAATMISATDRFKSDWRH